MEAFCNAEFKNISNLSNANTELAKMKEYFTYAQVIFCMIGVIGNILNLRTLQSPSLQTVPFMYIRAMAVFDLLALSLIMFHFAVENMRHVPFIMFYTTYAEAPVINSFLVAGLYCAFFLTVERFMLITRPYTKSISDPRKLARRKIALMLFCSSCFHLPMVLQRKLIQDLSGNYIIVNNIELLCHEPNWTLYNYYKLGRECLRFFIVILMTILNIFIARQLQITKNRRRRLVRRASPQREGSSTTGTGSSLCSLAMDNSNAKNESNNSNSTTNNNLMKSFTEKKLTVLMISICFIFIFGNVPQMIVMVLQNEALENVYGFQVYRYCSNLLEVVNHCLNFYVFCMASKEYTRAFLLNCVCLRNILVRFPKMASYLAARKSSMVANSPAGFGMENKEYLSMDSIADDVQQWTVDSTKSPYDSSESNLKSILVTGSRKESRQKKSLTIVNHLAVPSETFIDEDIEEL